MTNTIVLRYFDIRGKAEAIRMLLEQAGLQYEEVKVGAEWRGSLKKQYEEEGITTFGQLPVLSFNDKHLCQTNSILRYVAKKVGAYADNIDDQYKIDVVMDGVEDWRMRYVRLVYGNFDEEVESYKQTIPATLQVFERLLGDSHYFVGGKWSVADICVFDMLEHLVRLDENCLKQFANLNKFHQFWLQQPNIRSYLDSGRRPEKANNSGKG